MFCWLIKLIIKSPKFVGHSWCHLSYFNSSMLLFIYIFISHFTYWTKYIKYKHWIFWVIHTVYIEHFLFLSGHEAAESDPFSLAPCGVCAARECVYVGVCIRCNGRKVKNLFVDHFLLYWPIARVLSILMDISLFLHLYTCVVRNQNWPLFFYIWPPFSLQRFLCSSPFLMEKIKSHAIFFLVQYATRIYITIGKKSWTQFPVHGDFNLFFLSFGVFGFFLVRAIYFAVWGLDFQGESCVCRSTVWLRVSRGSAFSILPC